MSEFNTQQWVFFYDFAGIKLDSNDDPESLVSFGYKPLIQKYLPVSVKPTFTNSICALEGSSRRYFYFLCRNIIVKEDKIDDIELLRAKALALSQYMIINNFQKEIANVKEV